MLKPNVETEYRIEADSMGEVRVPASAYYGAQTQRAIDNFAVSGLVFPSTFITAIALVKKHSAEVNLEIGLLNRDLAQAIQKASEEIISGALLDQFVVDVFQTGSGTSTNMNANEVIAGRANEILTGVRGGKTPVHPNDHVNKGQSSNDVIPTVIHIASALSITRDLLPRLAELKGALLAKAAEFSSIRKLGRTHMQDAIPITLGDEFGGYARQIELGIERITRSLKSLSELALGGTAVGNGQNADPRFAPLVIEKIALATQFEFVEAANHFEAQASQDAAVEVSGSLKTLAVSLKKIANDIRLLSCGPRAGIAEINIPSLQPGSSIMPGKVNPVIPEMVIQTGAQVIANDLAITLGGQWGALELNVMLPLIGYNLLQSIDLLSKVVDKFTHKCIKGITANPEKCSGSIEKSLAMSTALAPVIGYEKAAAVSKAAFESGRSVREIAIELKVLPESEINELLDSMIIGSK